MTNIDPVTKEVVRNSLVSIVDQMGAALRFSAYSATLCEGGDFANIICTRNGELVCQGNRDLPSLAGVAYLGVKVVLEEFDISNIRRGDAILLNDPYLGGTHVNDAKMISPVFYDDDLVFFTANCGHWPDMGGRNPGSLVPDAVEIYQEGLRIPPVKLYKEGRLDKEILSLIMANIRVSEERSGDIRAHFAANCTGERRLKELMDRYGKEVVLACAEDTMEYSERRFRSEISKIPSGSYKFEDYLDSDGLTDKPVKFVVTTMIKNDEMTVDFTGTSKATKGPANMPYGGTFAGVFVIVKSIIGGNIPTNEGCWKPIKIVIPDDCVLNAKPPQPVSGFAETLMRVCDVMLGALAKAVPEKVCAGMYGTVGNVMAGGVDPETGKDYVYYYWLEGGWGGRSNKDGPTAISNVYSSGLNIPVEIWETKYPWLVETHQIRENSAGAGKYRGGFTTKRIMRLIATEAIVSIVASRQKFPPYGLFGGKPGKRLQLILNPGTPNERVLGAKSMVTMRNGDRLCIGGPGGGGYGDPLQRDPAAVKSDALKGYISIENSRKDYGVVLNLKTLELDSDATIELRRKMKRALNKPS